MRRNMFRMRGQASTLTNTLYVVMGVSVLVVFLMAFFNLAVEFSTEPIEEAESYTACDLATVVAFGDELTIAPQIFDREIIEQLSDGNGDISELSAEISDTIFENLSETYFISDSDYYLEFVLGEKTYSLYVPPESKSFFTDCARPRLVYSEGDEFEGWTLTTEGDVMIDVSEDDVKSELASYNEIFAECELPAFVASEDMNDMEIGTVKAALTTNLATKLRDGIYRVGVKGEDSVSYSLGSYPDGCIVNEGAYRVEDKGSLSVLEDFLKRIGSLLQSLTGISVLTDYLADYETHHKVVTTCGFDWGWETEKSTNKTTLTVIRANNRFSPLTLGRGDCPLVTRIPAKIVGESELSTKLCQPKSAALWTWFPTDEMSNYQYFLKVENVRGSWSAESAQEFCESRCLDLAESPWWFGEAGRQFCLLSCEKLMEESRDGTLKYDCYNIFSGGEDGKGWNIDAREIHTSDSRSVCSYAASQIRLYNNLPEDAIGVRYVAVESSKLENAAFEDLTEDDYYASASACAGWSSADSECLTSEDCGGTHCVNYQKGFCGSSSGSDPKVSEPDYWGLCSPNYLDYPPTVDDALFSCQTGFNELWPSTSYLAECLPVLDVSVGTMNDADEFEEMVPSTDKEYLEFDCSEDENSEAELTWIINASGLCCPNPTQILDDDGSPVLDDEDNPVLVCGTPPAYCLKMKFWSNLDSSEVSELVPRQIFDKDSGQPMVSPDYYVYTITQQVCRGGEAYNNAPYAFVTADFVTSGSSTSTEYRYSLTGSVVELIQN